MLELQQINDAYVDTPPNRHWSSNGVQPGESDAEVIIKRFFIHAHGELLEDDLFTSWRPFVQTSPDSRTFWSPKRIQKALDTLIDAGLLVPFESIYGDALSITEEARQNFAPGVR